MEELHMENDDKYETTSNHAKQVIKRCGDVEELELLELTEKSSVNVVTNA